MMSKYDLQKNTNLGVGVCLCFAIRYIYRLVDLENLSEKKFNGDIPVTEGVDVKENVSACDILVCVFWLVYRVWFALRKSMAQTNWCSLIC